ncbi:MAG TPA: PAS domain S-box protein [Vicinamibacterales bacterium]|nr:PAS domain S-box protein [Vicinamibacterales bacterium]
MSEALSADRLGELINFSVDAIVLVNADGVIRWANPATADVLGYSPADIVGVRVRDLVEPGDREAWQALVAKLIDDPKTPVRGTFRCLHQDGSVRWTEGVARNLLHEPRVGGIVVYYRDVTSRKATEQQLKETEDRYGHLFSLAADVIFEADAEGYFRFVNPQTLRLFEFAEDEVIGRRFTEFIRADYRPQILQHYYKQTTEGRLNSYIEFPAITKSGTEVWLGQNAWIMTDSAGKICGMQAVARDITERRRSEEALRTAEAKYRALVEQSLMGVYIMQNNRLVYVNPKAADLLGYTQQEMIDSASPYNFVHEQDRPLVVDQLGRLDPALMPSVQLAVRGVRKDGEVIQVEAFCSVTDFGNERAILTTVHDISDRVKLEDQLRQAQKMEAVGRLAGGIAHDFNNLLTAIRGNAELMSHRVKHDPPMAAEVDEILHAADRAASLTRQLLAFSRKQVLQPVALDLNEIVSSVSRMARRLIGTDVQLRLDLARSIAQVLADPAQVEQVLLNLIVNARDAMPSGGHITVLTQNVRLESGSPEIVQAGIAPGAFVMLSVTDDGIGMDKATQARIFEPFFTTKETGRGTGLGLSTVYGIIRQTGGAITVVSERGKGAIFKVYLPAVVGESQ